MYHVSSFFLSCFENDQMFLICQVVKSGSTETRVEKRIVITADSDTGQDKVTFRLQRCPLMRGAGSSV